MKILGLLLIIVGLPCASFASADDQELVKEKTVEQKLIEDDVDISGWFDGVADGLDLFLAGRRLTRDRNQTFVRIENSTFFKEHQEANNVSNIIANLRFPNFEKYWQLKFSSYDENNERRNVNTEYLRNAPRERNYGATLGLFRKLGNVRVTFQPRVDLQNGFKLSQTLAFDSVGSYKGLQINPRLEFFAYADRGTGSFQSLNFNWKLSKRFSLTFVNQGEYDEKPHTYNVGNGISLGQVLSDTNALTYNYFFLSGNRPNYHLLSHSASVTYTEVLYRKILDYGLTPHVDFDEVRGYAAALGFTFDLNLTF